MAAVLALVMVPLFASLGFFWGASGDGSWSSGFAMATFTLLGTGLLFGLLKFVRGLEE